MMKRYLRLSALALLAACSGATQTAQIMPGGEHDHAMAGAGAAAQPMAGEHEHEDEDMGGGQMPRHNRHLLVTAEWLAAHLDSNVVVVHVGRSDSLYLAGHIPGARFLPLSAVATTVGNLTTEFPPPETMAARFSSLVIRENDRIVLLGDDAGTMAARAWVALDLMGHGDRAALLDGGLAAWRAQGGRLDPGPIALIAMHTPFPVRWQAQKLVTADWVRAHLADSTVLLVDARPADQYAGTETCTGAGCIAPERRGHIVGAASLTWTRALAGRDVRTVRQMHELHHELWQPAGADRARTIVSYCRSGFQASHTYWQARYVGYADVRLYDGSFAEWSALPAADHPVVRGPAPR